MRQRGAEAKGGEEEKEKWASVPDKKSLYGPGKRAVKNKSVFLYANGHFH